MNLSNLLPGLFESEAARRHLAWFISGHGEDDGFPPFGFNGSAGPVVNHYQRPIEPLRKLGIECGLQIDSKRIVLCVRIW